MKKYVIASLRVQGIHCWPDCPIKEVSYLKDPHRHMFHIKVWKKVSHNDRDVEIIMLKNKINKALLDTYGDKDHVCRFDSMSCEDIAEWLIALFDLDGCEVLEDGENGALIFH